MHIRETLGCVVHVALIVIVGTALAATLAIFATEYLKLPDWTRWIFKGLVISLMTAGGLCLLPVALSFDNYARFTEQGVHMNRFWSLRERFVPHSEVEAITELTHYKNLRTGAIEPYESPSYEVRLRDGTVFSTAHLRHRYDDYTHQLMRWWSEQAGVPIRKATRGVDW